MSIQRRVQANSNDLPGRGSDDLPTRFRESALRLVSMAASIDVKIRAFQNETLPYFSGLTTEQQLGAVERLEQYVGVCQDVISNGDSFRSSRTFIWRALSKYGLIPDSSLFNTISEDDVVEVYNLEGIQIFCNFRFFEFCSYTLEDLYSRAWHDLFKRDDHVRQHLISFILDAVASGSRTSRSPNLGPQRTQEINSVGRHLFDVEVKAVSILYNSQDQARAFISSEGVAFA